MNFPILSAIIALPLFGAVLLQLVRSKSSQLVWGITVFLSGLGLAFALVMLGSYSTSTESTGIGAPLALHFQERYDWISGIGASYHVGVDAISAWLLGLNNLLFFLGALAIRRASETKLRFYCTLLLLGQAATGGVLVASDLLLFYVFWEGMLIPLYFLLANFGGPDRGPATMKFVGYTVAGSVLMLLAIIFVYIQAGGTSFDLQTLIAHPGPEQGHMVWFGVSWLNPSQLAFLAFALAFAIKMPLVPFHTWLPKLYESCPPQALVFVAGIVSKLGAYGFLRFGTTLFPVEMRQFQWLLIGLALISVIYGALMALGSTDLKRIIGYASISHMGFIGLGIFTLTSVGISGSLLQMINHGIIIAALFLMVGYIEEHSGTRDLGRLSGLEKRMPVMYILFLIATLAALGMPGLNGFVGEFTIMLGAFLVQPAIAVVLGIGVLLAAWYMLRLHQGLMHEPTSEAANNVPDIGWNIGLLLAPLVIGMVLLGLYPKPITDLSNGSVARYAALIAAPPEVQTTTGATQ